MATDMGSPPRFFHMPRFQHQAPRQLFYKRPDFAQQQAMQQLTFDGKRMRKAVNRKTIDYNPSVIRYLENRLWQRDHRDFRAIQPDSGCYNDLVPPVGMLNNPMNAVTTKFVRTSTNKVKCPVFVVRWTPEGRRLVTGASSGEFTLWNGLTFNFETILQAHDSPVRAMTWSHNDMWMLTADHGGYVKYWQSNMNNVKMFQAHKEAIREASFSPTDNKFATCSDDGTVRIWDFLRCHEERILRGHGADVKCVDWHPTKGLVVSGSKDSQQPIKFWDPKTGQSLATLHAHKNTVMEVKWNLNGNWLLTASRDHLCKLFDIRNLKEELQVFRGHKKEATAVAWHPVHEGLFASGGSDGSLLFWNAGVEKEVGGMEMAHEGMIWSLAWHPLGHILCSGSNDHTSKFWTRNRPGDKMRDRYNLNLLPGMSEDGVEYGESTDACLVQCGDPTAWLPSLVWASLNVEMTIPGLDWGMEEVMQKDQKKVPQKKVPYAKPIPAQFQQAWAENKVPALPPGEMPKERKDEKKVDGKKKTQAEIEQEMAALQYTNPLLLEQLKIERLAQKQSDQTALPPGQQGALQPFPGQGSMVPPTQGFPQSLPPQPMPHSMPHNMPPMGPGGLQGSFLPQGQMGPAGPQLHQGPPQGFMGPPDMHGPQNLQRHPGPLRHMGPQGPHGIPPGSRGMTGAPQGGIQGPSGPQSNMMPPPPRGMGPRDSQGPGPQGMIPQDMRGPLPQGNMMSHQALTMHGPQGQQNPPRTHGNMQGPPGSMQGHPANMHGPPGNMQGHPGNVHAPPGTMQGHSPFIQQGKSPLLGDGSRGQFNQVSFSEGCLRCATGDTRALPNHHLGPHPDRRGSEGAGGPDQVSDRAALYWGESRDGGEDGWRPQRGPAQDYPGDARAARGGAAGKWESHRGPDERYPRDTEEARFRGRREERFASSSALYSTRSIEAVKLYVFVSPGHEVYRDGQRSEHCPRDSPSGPGRERSSSLQGMDMASLPPRKRPWHDGPGTADPRDSDGSGSMGEDRGRDCVCVCVCVCGASLFLTAFCLTGRPSQRDPHRDEGGYGVSSRGGRGGWGRGGAAGGGAAGGSSGPTTRRGANRGMSRGGRSR
uniref:pre-mRNA 3' end processing protein WDR33 n=1 Tax=Scleropages formosus TaxID=113540 RepID=A0A8C9WMT8_SCLFO